MIDSEGVRYTLAQYSQFVDDRSFDDLADLFTDDAKWTVLGTTYSGRPAIRTYMSTWQPGKQLTKHLTLNSVIDTEESSARATSDYIVVYQTDQGGVVKRAGRYLDELRKDDDRWRFASRTHAGASWALDWTPPHAEVPTS
jgi:uncharacterized protein (TIGR02246 family)